jgi:hypothetical protein
MANFFLFFLKWLKTCVFIYLFFSSCQILNFLLKKKCQIFLYWVVSNLAQNVKDSSEILLSYLVDSPNSAKSSSFLPSTDLVWCLHTNTFVPRHPMTLAQIILLLPNTAIYLLFLIFNFLPKILNGENEESCGIFR